MKTLITGLILLTITTGCKGLINPSLQVKGDRKICTANYIVAPDLIIDFELVNKDFESSRIFINGDELLNKCESLTQNCNEPYYILNKNGLNKVSIKIFDSSYQSLDVLDVKLELLKNSNPISVIEKQESLNWIEEEQDNCQILRSANIHIKEE